MYACACVEQHHDVNVDQEERKAFYTLNKEKPAI